MRDNFETGVGVAPRRSEGQEDRGASASSGEKFAANTVQSSNGDDS